MNCAQRRIRLRDLFSRGVPVSDRLMLAWDLAMIGLVSINLALIIFDSLFVIGFVANGIHGVSPRAHDWYASAVHAHFAEIDLAFVGVFVTDVVASWALAIYQRRYPRWFFYPFVHWYDVLGCIPVAGFRFLRVFRVISIVMRLQKLGAIDVQNWAAYRYFMVYYDILVEEISDRVVIKVLSGTQDELTSGGSKLARRAIDEVLEPRRERLVKAGAARLESVINDAYDRHRVALQRTVADVVHRGVARNAAVKNLQRLPILGRTLNHALDDAIRDTVNNILDETVASANADQFEQLFQSVVDEAIERMLAEERSRPSEANQVVVEILDLVKDQVAVQRWREHFEDTSDESA